MVYSSLFNGVEGALMAKHKTHGLMLTQILDGKTYEDVNGDRYKAMNNMKTKDVWILHKKVPSGWDRFSGLINIHKQQFKLIEAPSVEQEPIHGS